MNKCTNCGSYAINPHMHGRYGDRLDLCDVCYWQMKFKELKEAARPVVEAYLADKKWLDEGDYYLAWHKSSDPVGKHTAAQLDTLAALVGEE